VIVTTLTRYRVMSDCDQWIARITAEAGDRVDEASYTAKQKVDDIARMCHATAVVARPG
jgi:hypothetical protein